MSTTTETTEPMQETTTMKETTMEDATDRSAPVDRPVHPLFRDRWSTLAYADEPVEEETLASLLEAARWAASSFNEQPWSFLVARREDDESFQRMLSTLAEGNRAWAKDAPVLMVSLAKTAFDRDGRPNAHAWHDVGQAAAHLALEAAARDLSVHQMAGFDADRVRELYDVPEGVEPVAAIAVGHPGDPDDLPEDLRDRELSPRTRRPLEETVFGGRWGEPAEWLAGAREEAPAALTPR